MMEVRKRAVQLLFAMLARSCESDGRGHSQAIGQTIPPQRLLDASLRVSKLYGYTLLDALDQLAADEKFVRTVDEFALREDVLAAGATLRERLRSTPDERLTTLFAGVPHDLALRAIRTLRVTTMLDIIADASDALTGAPPRADDLAESVQRTARLLDDPTYPATECLVWLESLRGGAAAVMFATCSITDTSQHTRLGLFSAMVGGLEHSARLLAAAIDDDLGVVADHLITTLGLTPIDRQALVHTRHLLTEARQALAKASEALDSDDFILPPDPHFGRSLRDTTP